MYKINLNEVEYPINFVEQYKKSQEDARRNLIIKGKTEEEAEKLVPDEEFDKVGESEQALKNAMDHHMVDKYFNQERQTIIAPLDIRRKVTKIKNKIDDSADGVFELSDEQMEFVRETFKGNLPMADMFIYLGDYFDTLRPQE